jgi:hypothetical protein
MTVRQSQPDGYGEEMARSGPPPAFDLPGEWTVPLPPVPAAGGMQPDILGFPAEFADDGAGERPAGVPASGPLGQESETSGEPGNALELAVLRRADRIGGLALIFAGVAAGVSLWLPWRNEGVTGLSLARQGVAVFGAGIGELGRSGLWQPLAVVLGGGALLVLGLLLLLRARTHRLVGVLALLVAVAAAAGVLLPLAAAGWSPASFRPGMWCAVAVAGLGVLGALKAMLTAPLVRLRPGWSGRSRAAH